MKVSKLLMPGLLLAICAGSAFAAKRGVSEGAWQTGEFSEPQHVSRWGYGATDQGSINKITADESAVKLDTTSGLDTWVYFPNTKDLDLDVSNLTAFRFSLKSENKNGWNGDPWVILKDMAGNSATFRGTKNRLPEALKGWVHFTIPMGAALQPMATETENYLKIDEKKRGPSPVEWLLTTDPGFDWKHIASFEFHADTGGYGFIMWHDGVEFTSGSEPVKWWLSSLDKPDLSVVWAEQFPHYQRYTVDYKNVYPELTTEQQKMKHWPDKGESIYYEVHVKNVGFRPSDATDFVCTIDGKVAAKASIPSLGVREETIVKVPWRWKKGPYKWEARVDTACKMDEICKKNNLLTFQTDAYSLYAICEKGMTEQVDAVNNIYGSFSYEDWMRGDTVDTMNRLFRHSKFDFAPEGAKIGVRIGRIYVVDKITDDTQSKYDVLACDGGWSYGSAGAMEYCNLANSYMWALNHELTHQLGIIDDYNLDFTDQNNMINGKGFSQPDGGMMGGGHVGNNTQPAYSDIDVAGMNATYGYRRGYFGEYLFNIPKKNTLVLRVDGKPLVKADVEIYTKMMSSGWMDGEPLDEAETDSRGRFTLANLPVPKTYTTATGCTLHPNPFGHIDVVGRNGLMMIRVNSAGTWYYEFIDIGHFVCEYARGHKKAATYTIDLKPE